ncbi:FAD/NAD(P)-binding protein [Dictyobacter formicarum]|uniref:Ni/Fe hydrogenase subunit gamma n=1 Tax=Dictyobacter formicarum TaxID=2778368 RepID=A0ABQ3VRJ5_9CHLR|nr:FAD/NAD(P)-binding protein [Dictyobacter formicarum]GHO88453.1 Ni/Fe hydrogenase subunit gamma [Dictyobacter formicarum]
MMLVDRNDPMLPRWYRIQRRLDELPNIFTLDLEPADKGNIPSFLCGQFNMLYVFGVGEIPISISGDPDHPDPLIHTIRAVGNVSNALQILLPGAVLGVRGPFGQPWPLDQAQGKDLLLVAGGLGLAPLRSVMCQIIANRQAFGRVTLLYGARTPEDILYRKDCERWRAQLDLDVVVTVDRATNSWRGSVGVVTRLIARALFEPANTLAFVCGPEIMMRFAATELEKCGVPGEQIFISMERNMKCAIGFCGHCQYGPTFVCKDGPVIAYNRVRDLLFKREI